MYMCTYYTYCISVSFFLDSKLLKVIGGVSLFFTKNHFTSRLILYLVLEYCFRIIVD